MKYIHTDLYRNFKCIGGDCTETCCGGWNIVIDKETYDKYTQLDDNTRDWICGNIKQGEDGAYLISTNEQGWCPFLNQDNLCDIILKVSEDYISEVCHIYPRKITKYNDIEFCTVSVSCPEVARQIIEHKGQIQFIIDKEEKTSPKGESSELFDALMMGFFTSIEILQNQQLSLSEKYLILLLLVEEIQIAIDQNKIDQIQEITEKYKRKKYRRQVIDSLDNVFSMKFDHWNMVSLLLNILMESEIEGKQYIYTKTVDALNILDSSTYEIWKNNYKKIEIHREKENLAVQFMFEYFMDAFYK